MIFAKREKKKHCEIFIRCMCRMKSDRDSHAYTNWQKTNASHMPINEFTFVWTQYKQFFFLLLLDSCMRALCVCSRSPFRSCPFPNYIIVHLEYIYGKLSILIISHSLLFIACYSLQN